jgi:hypothetical protein
MRVQSVRSKPRLKGKLMAIVTQPDDAVDDQPPDNTPLSRKESGQFARLAASLRNLPGCSEQRRAAREANAGWLAVRDGDPRKRLRERGQEERKQRARELHPMKP